MEEVQDVTVSNNATEATVYYKRIDVEGGMMTDIDEIENYKSVQRRDVISNYMLGDFNDVGDYIIAEKVLSGLVSIKKTVSNEYNNMIFLKSVSEFAEKNKLEFCIVVKELSDSRNGYATAIMKLLEPVNKINGYITNTNSFIVASFTDVNDENFIGKVKRVFGVVESNDTNGKDDPKVVADIINRITFLRHCKDMSLSVFATVESDYYHGRLEILKQDPAYEEILKKYRNLILKANMFLDPNSPEYHAYMNELLDQAIDNAINENPTLKDKLKIAMKEIDAKHNEASSKYTIEIVEKANEMMNQVPVAKANEKVAAKKVEEIKVEKKIEAKVKAAAAASKTEVKKASSKKSKKKVEEEKFKNKKDNNTENKEYNNKEDNKGNNNRLHLIDKQSKQYDNIKDKGDHSSNKAINNDNIKGKEIIGKDELEYNKETLKEIGNSLVEESNRNDNLNKLNDNLNKLNDHDLNKLDDNLNKPNKNLYDYINNESNNGEVKIQTDKEESRDL